MFQFKHITPFIAAALLSVSCCTSAAAAVFTDVNEGSPYYKSVAYVSENDIANGIGNGLFAPDRTVTKDEFIKMYIAAMHSEEYEKRDQSLPWQESVRTLAVSLGLLSEYEANAVSECTWPFIIDLVFNDLGYKAYNMELWDVDILFEGLNIPETNNFVCAKQYGLFDGVNDINPLNLPTRAETAQVIYNLCTGNVKQKYPEAAYLLDEVYEVESIRDENAVLLALKNIPEECLQSFKDKGWELHIMHTPIRDIHPDYAEYGSAIGITDPSRKRIYAYAYGYSVSTMSVCHEFGHLALNDSGLDYPDEVFAKEREAISDFFRKYAATNKREAFADIYAYCVMYGKDKEKMAEMQAAVPNSAAFVIDNFFAAD